MTELRPSDKSNIDRRLYHETCRYVERIQETFNQTLSVQDWERTVEKVYNAMKFLVPNADSAGEQHGG